MNQCELTLDLFALPEPNPTPKPLIEISVLGIEQKSPEQIAHLSRLALAVAAKSRANYTHTVLGSVEPKKRALEPETIDGQGVSLRDLAPEEFDVLRVPGTEATMRVVSVGVGLEGVNSFGAMADPDAWNKGLAQYQEANGRGCGGLDLEFARFAKHRSIDPHPYAFIAQARHHGHTDPCLEPVAITEGGRRLFNEIEVIRFANELLRGVRSDRPGMTPERWAEAIQKVRQPR